MTGTDGTILAGVLKCIGPRGAPACPYGADVKPADQTTVDGVATLTRYWHCWRCLKVYLSQRPAGERWPSDPFTVPAGSRP